MLIGCSASVASIKTIEICDQLAALDMNVILVPTANSLHFLTADIENTPEPLTYLS